MRPIYLIKDYGSFQRKVMLDMAWLSSYKEIRLPKYKLEDGIYLPHKSNNDEIEKYFLTKDKIVKEDENHYFFKFPFKPEEVEKALNKS